MFKKPRIYRSKRDKVVKSSKEENRVINLKYESSAKKYPSNKIITSKYTLWNFLPKNLFEQFRRMANFYFLCMAISSFFIDTPVSPVTSLLPLLFVVAVSSVKQGYEDFWRHKADKEINKSLFKIIRKGCIQMIPSEKITVGDLVKIERDQHIPCDLVLLLSSHSESKCYLNTSNLDGETSLKTYHCPTSLRRTCTTEEDLYRLEATIRCENPTPHLYTFHGRIEYGPKTSSFLRRSALQRQQSAYSTTRGDDEELGDGTFRDSQLNTPTQEIGDSTKTSKYLVRQHLYRKKKGAEAKRTESFPKSAIKTHMKTLSNVDRESFNLEKTATSTSNVKEWSYERKASLVCKRNPSLLNNNRKSFTTADGLLVDALSSENVLLRGSKLECTDYIYGCTVYTGRDTKLALNTKLSNNKFSTVEKSINKFLLFFLGLLLVQVTISTAFKAIMENKSGYDEKKDTASTFSAVYLCFDDFYIISFGRIFADALIFISIYSYVIPISLYVTMEFQKFLGTLFFEWDLKMYEEETNETALCNTSDLNEDLGQIEYLFTDKTGTLTKNEMQFARCSVNGVQYEERNGKLYPLTLDTEELNWKYPVDLKHCTREMELFLCALTLCHTVQVSRGGEKYSAISPDELALIEAMKKLDIIFADDDDEIIVIKILGQEKVFKKLELLEFSSERKRMSVIIEDEEGNITLYCKGAETSVIPQVIDGPKETTLSHVAHFAKERLRTLVVGYKFLTRDEYHKISERLKHARQTLSDQRDKIVAQTYAKVESDLTVLGATGIKDDIQEEVKETLKSLREAGIRIWMLTGDKLETAENISLECGHFEENFERFFLKDQNNPDNCRKVLKYYLQELDEGTTKKYGLIVDGESLTTALAHCKDLFRNLCIKCTAVICSRMSPLQKKQVVQLVKDQKRPPITAAIGDGANDVAMIQEAHVGIGIMGKEGRQAVRSSDFAFSKFKFLRRTLLVHGHWYYLRIATLVQYFFYKNIAFVLPQFYFFFFSGHSIQSLYDSLYMVGYNTIFTSLPVLIYGLFEQDYADRVLEKSPHLYLIHRKNALMSWPTFLQWFFLGLWHSAVVFFLPAVYYYLNSSVMLGGRDAYLEVFGTLVFHSSVAVVSLKLLLHSKYWSGIFVGSILLSGLVLVLFSIVYSLIFLEKSTASNYWVYINLLGSPTTWLLLIIICATALLPDFVVYAFKDRKKFKFTTSNV